MNPVSFAGHFNLHQLQPMRRSRSHDYLQEACTPLERLLQDPLYVSDDVTVTLQPNLESDQFVTATVVNPNRSLEQTARGQRSARYDARFPLYVYALAQATSQGDGALERLEQARSAAFVDTENFFTNRFQYRYLGETQRTIGKLAKKSNDHPTELNLLIQLIQKMPSVPNNIAVHWQQSHRGGRLAGAPSDTVEIIDLQRNKKLIMQGVPYDPTFQLFVYTLFQAMCSPNPEVALVHVKGIFADSPGYRFTEEEVGYA